MKESVRTVFKEATRASVGWATVLIVLGVLVVSVPYRPGIAVSILISWIVVLSGLVHLASAFTGRDAGAFVWRMLIGVAYILCGTYLAFHPKIALESLTVVLAILFVFEGLLELGIFLLLRVNSGSGWVLFHALVALLFAFMIALPWPLSSMEGAGAILGINLIVSGVSVLLYLLEARKTLGELNL